MTTHDTLKSLPLSEEWPKSTLDGRNHGDPRPAVDLTRRKDHALDQTAVAQAIDVKHRSTVGERTAEQIAQGRTVPGSRPPFGYKTVRIQTQYGVEKRWEHKEPEADEVRQIYALATSKSGWRMSCASIARKMSLSGSKRLFTSLSVHRILTSVIYTGTSTRCVSIRDGTWVKLTAPPLVSVSAFRTVQTLLASRRRKKLEAASGGPNE